MTVRRYRFRRSMLNDRPGNVTLAVKRVIVRAVNHDLVVTSTTGGRHATTSYHYQGKAVDVGGPHARMVAFQRYLCRRRRRFYEVFGPDNTANVKNGVRITLLEGSSLESLHDNHVHAAPRSLLPKLRLPRPVRTARLVRRARRHGARHVRTIMREARRAKLPLALALAVVEQESRFRNVYGHDAVANPAPKGGKVTRFNYRHIYLPARKAGKGMQGVGPAQLTWYALQDEADRHGGCWRVGPNLRVAFAHLAVLIRAYGTADGIRRYNGSGAAAERYSVEVRRRAAAWKLRLG